MHGVRRCGTSTAPHRPAPQSRGDRSPLPRVPIRPREDPLADPLVLDPHRDPAYPGPGRHPGRLDRRLGPHRVEAVERRGTRRPDRSPRHHQWGPVETDHRAAGGAVRRVAPAPRRRRVVDRAEGRPLRPGPLGGGRLQADRLGVALPPGIQPPGPPAAEPARRDRRRATGVEKTPWPNGGTSCAASTRARPSSCGPRMRPGWG
jgi:hypothetical protein